MKQMNCGDIISGCKHVVRGYTANEILRKAGEHGMKEHHLPPFDQEMEKKVNAAINEVPDEGKIDPTEDTHGK
jgi:predicted small metal-binding protein